ncbi:MAG: hypothetical protein WCE56_12255, partial [Desulfobacterales bacterium]
DGRFDKLPAASPLFFPTLPNPKLSIDNSVHRFINSMTNLYRLFKAPLFVNQAEAFLRAEG